ncbi:MAG: glycosyltransferase [Pseudomonadota bacterium]|nr:glycosyltransferase [Pseudomonadota bacterium]
MPKVSTITPVLNGVKTIGRSIESAQRQTFKDIEIVVVDDGSTDGTADLVRSYAAQDPRIKLVQHEKNMGGAAASNKAIESATGEWIAILDADDWFEPTRIEDFLKIAEQYPVDAVADNLKLYDHATDEIVDRTYHQKDGRLMMLDTETYIRRDNPLQRHSLGYIQPMFKKQFVTDHNIKYDVSHRYAYDFIFVAEFLLSGGKIAIIPEAYYVYVHRISPTTRKRSPHSRSEAGHNMILRGCDELVQKYGARMTPPERAAMQQRRYIFESRVICEDMLDALRDRQLLKAGRILLGRPFIFVLIGNTLFKQFYVKTANYWRRIKKLIGIPVHV